jgi:CRISPR-associated protein Csb3
MPNNKTWSGQQSSYGILSSLYQESCNIKDIEQGFEYTTEMTGRLSVDFRSSWTGLDAGFSPNTQGMSVTTYPFVEFFAAIGLQRFRPTIVQSNQGVKRYYYSTWIEYLPAPLGCIARHVFQRQKIDQYEFTINKRGQYKYFTKATKV